MTAQTPTEAEAFHAFLTRQLSGVGREKTPEELVQLWRTEYNEAVNDIRLGMLELEAGKVRPLREADAEIRQKYNIPTGD